VLAPSYSTQIAEKDRNNIIGTEIHPEGVIDGKIDQHTGMGTSSIAFNGEGHQHDRLGNDHLADNSIFRSNDDVGLKEDIVSAKGKDEIVGVEDNGDPSFLGKRRATRDNRKRKSKLDPSAGGNHYTRRLVALFDQDREFTVKIVVANQPFHDEEMSSNGQFSLPDTTVGNDGNQHYCQVCRDFGDVVCCDGCPRVYHRECLPLESPSRIALDNDADPWFCPKCIEKNKKVVAKVVVKTLRISADTEKLDRASSHRRCVDCSEVRADLKLVPCTSCGAYVHSPSCIASKLQSHPDKSQKIVCFNCQVIDREEEIASDTSPVKGTVKEPTKVSQQEKSDTDASNVEEEEPRAAVAKERKPRQSRVTLLGPKRKNGTSSDKKLEKKLKKKKKDRKRTMSSADVPEEEFDEAARQQSIRDDPILQPRGSSKSVQAIPAFCFYLAENRWKIERSLSKKHRTFNRLPKGDERNALVAQEAAVWWTKLEPSEHKLYINMSIRDFETRVIQWKEEKDAKEQLVDGDIRSGKYIAESDFADNDTSAMDVRLIDEMHERLYLSTSVGSKPFKLETDQSYNRVLLDLLHDVRFHPVPMLNINRPDIDGLLSDDHSSKVTIPFFEVHGPVSTSLGDECLGCSRGWTHFCSVVQRRIPAIEHRAKLQPPLSSLLATRIGLGLRPHFDDSVEEDLTDENKSHELFQWRESIEIKELRQLPVVPSCHVFDPKDRADDMTLFIEETVAMKIPEPMRPSRPKEYRPKKSHLRSLPIHHNKDSFVEGTDEITESLMYNKCGRCRTMIPNDTGCVPCRRAQLVINKSKVVASASPKHGDGKSLKVHTTMLGRLHVKEGTGEVQRESDLLISEAMLKVRWSPSAVLPPRKLHTPERKVVTASQPSDEYDSTDDEEVKSISAENDRTSNEPHSLEVYSNLNSTSENGFEPDDKVSAQDDVQDVTEPPSKRLRTARSVSLVDKETIVPELDRPQLQKHYKKETSEVHKKVTRIACYGLLLGVMRRDPLNLFEEPVVAEGYSAIIQNPIHMKKIRENVVSGHYNSLSAFVSDVKLLCENSIAYNPPSSIYHKTAKEILDVLAVMQARANTWIATIKAEHTKYLQQRETIGLHSDETLAENPFEELRKKQPNIFAMLDQEEKLFKLVNTDFRRTIENETAYYGCLAIRRAATAAEASLAPYPNSCGQHSVVTKRKYYEDEELRDFIDSKVGDMSLPLLRSVSTWREEATLRLVRKVQKLRVERRLNMDRGCSRCNIYALKDGSRRSMAKKTDVLSSARTKKKSDLLDVPKVAFSRSILATGLASAKTCQRILQRSIAGGRVDDIESLQDFVVDACVSVRGSKIHGMGLFADQPFAQGDIVAEYLGEYIVNPVAEAREKFNEEQRIQDYQFRLDETTVIDATTRGGWARYINHSCTPNCKTVIVPVNETDPLLRRVMIVAHRSIEFNEELSYDYQFPLELDLNARIPCNCQSEACRGFMNWDLPEKGTNNRALLIIKRGANMRDRIRRLGRPLKRGET
jgi:Bromodomain/SET domain/PHD-finger